MTASTMNRWLLGLGAMLALAIASACGTATPLATGGGAPGPDVPPPLRSNQTVEISFTNYNVASAGIGKEATEKLVNEFMEKFPNIKVVLRPVSANDIAAKTRAEVVAGNPPDLAQLIFDDLDFIVNDLRAKPLDKIVAPDEFHAYTGGEHPLHPRGLKLTELDGKLYGVPYVFSTPTLFYNATVFRQAGLDPDAPPKTWADVKRDAIQIKERTGLYGIDVACLGRFDWCFQGLILSNGGRVMSLDRRRLMFAESEAVEVVAIWQDLVKRGVHAPSALASADGFSAGKVAMQLQTSASQGSYTTASKDKWELRSTGMPSFGEKPVAPTNSGSGLFILSDDPAKQRAAWELMKFLTSERGFTVITSEIGYLPLRPTIVQDARYLKPWADRTQLVQPNLRQLDALQPWVAFPGPNYQQIRGIMMKAAEEVVLTGSDPAATMADAERRATSLMPKR